LFAFSVARLLGCFVDDIMERMTAKELAEWEVFLTSKPEDLVPAVNTQTTESRLKSMFGYTPPPRK
jgi:hypothetical protein